MQDSTDTAQAVSSDRLARWERRITASADRVADALRRRKYVVLFLFSSFYWLATCFRASRKLFWFDELFTVYVSRLPDMTSVWNALKQGVDFNPPLFYGLIRLSEALFGEGHIGTRLPAILGFWIFCLCLFRFVSSRTSVLAGLISMLFPLATSAYFYAYEARAHGIVLGFGGIALVCWQAAIRSRRRNLWPIGLFVALLCATLTHAYAILLVAPFALAEFARSVSRRRVDWAVWLAIVSSSLGALASLPLLRALNVDSMTGLPRGSILANSYQNHLGPAVGILAAGVILYFVFRFIVPGPPAAPNREQSFELPEVVALFALVAMPFATFFLATLTGAPLLYRYSISVVGGFACLLGVVAARKPPVGVGIFLFLVLQIGLNLFVYAHTHTVIEPSSAVALSTTTDSVAHQYRMMEAVPNRNLPIVLLANTDFLQLLYYAPANLASRLVRIVYPDVDAAGQFYMLLHQLCGAPGRPERLADFLSAHDVFLVHCNSGSFERLNYFIRAGAEVKIEGVSGDNFIFSVTLKKNQSESVTVPPR